MQSGSARGWINMNALETRLASSSELHRGAAMGELRNEPRNELRNEARNEPRSDTRVIKKYPNRRLYDTVESRYITLADVRKLVVDRVDFVVIDKKTQQDITRGILLQVIAEQEHGGEPLMSRDFLSQVIRSYGGQMQGMIGSYLEQSLKLFATQQREVRDRVKSVVGIDPVDAVTSIAQKNYQRWKSVQDEIYKTLTGGANRARADETEEKKV